MKKLLAIILAVAMVLSMAVVASADEISLGGTAYEETVVCNVTTTSGGATVADGVAVDEWSWNSFVYYGSSNPSLGEFINAMNADNAYVKITMTGNIGSVLLQGDNGSGSTNSAIFSTLDADGNTVKYYSGKAIADAYMAESGYATPTEGTWNIHLTGNGSTGNVVYGLAVVTLEEAVEAPEAIDVTLYEDEAGNTFTGDAATYLDPWGGFGICSEVNGQNVGNISLAELVTYAEMEGAELVITFAGGGFWGGSKPETEVQFNCWDTEEDLQVKFDIATLPSGVNKGTVKFADLLAKLEALGLTSADIRNLGVQVWASEFKLHTVAIHVPAPEVEEEVTRGSGYFMTGDETHAMIIGKAIITTNHVFDEDGDCKYCGHHVDVEVEDIIVEQPTESTEEESEDITVEEPKEDTNPGTGLTLAVIPAIIALAAVVISKR